MEAKKQRVHIISTGGSVMQYFALALHHKGDTVTTSDENPADTSRQELQNAGIMPLQAGWFPEKISQELDAVIFGPEVRADNPELKKARELGLRVYSYAQYVCELSKDKQRIVISGSHGKTSITSMILHVLKYFNRKFDYVVDAPSEGFEQLVKLSTEAPLIVIEGDEFPVSLADKTPAFLQYHHHIAVISGIEWDHVNVYPNIDEYVKQFELLADSTPKGGSLIFSESDDLASVICRKEREDVQRVEYHPHKCTVDNTQTFLLNGPEKIPVQVFGKHNMKNISGAKAVCMKIGITEEMFYKAIQSFKGTSNRLEVLEKNGETIVFKDFAHTPFKLKATTKAVKNQFPGRDLVAVFELHTFSALHKEFLSQFKDTFKLADEPVVFIDPEVVKTKNLPPLTAEEVKNAFNHPKLEVLTDKSALEKLLTTKSWKNKNLLLMSSGSFAGSDLKELAKSIVGK